MVNSFHNNTTNFDKNQHFVTIIYKKLYNEIIEFNQNHITKDETDKVARKVRGIILNQEGKALVAKNMGIYILPGGSIEVENIKQALQRELLEEAGIEQVELEDIPFLKIENYDAKHYDKVSKKPITKLTETYFYFGKTQEQVNKAKQNLTESEKKGDFSISFQNLSVIEYLVEHNQTDNPKQQTFDREILTTLREFKKYRQEQLQELEER